MRAALIATLAACKITSGTSFEQYPSLFDGKVRSVVFDDGDSPSIGTDVGMFRWDGSNWPELPRSGLPQRPDALSTGQLSRGTAGELYTVVYDQMFRLAPGASSWELFSQGIPREPSSPTPAMGDRFFPPVIASDGTLFTMRTRAPDPQLGVWYRLDGADSWVDSGLSRPAELPSPPQPDESGNIWAQEQRIDRATTESVPPFPGIVFAVVGSLHYGVGPESIRFGDFWVWNQETGEQTQLGREPPCEAGVSCGKLVSATVDADGTVYQIRGFDGDAGTKPRQLLRLTPHADHWDLFAGAGQAVFKRDTGRVWIDHAGRVYVTGSDDEQHHLVLLRLIE